MLQEEWKDQEAVERKCLQDTYLIEDFVKSLAKVWSGHKVHPHFWPTSPSGFVNSVDRPTNRTYW
jgi:hypothetical protein